MDRTMFAAGYDEYRPVMMWFWNDRIDKEEIRRQIDEFAEQRIYQFFIHPNLAMEEEYLSERFFGLIEAAVKHAQAKGMKYWIYDEYAWPSGMVGGKLIRDYPEYRMLAVKRKNEWLNQGQTAEISFPGRFLAAQATYGATMRDVTHEGVVDNGQGTFTWTNRDMSLCNLSVFMEEQQGGVFASSMATPYSWYQEGYLDTMNPEAVRKFLDMTHEQYYSRFGEHFGQTIEGIFTDEPNLANPFDFGPGTIPWTKDFGQIFLETNGYELLPRLIQLTEEVGDYRRTRYDYWNTITERFASAFAVQTAKWCEDHNIKLTGHCSGEENLVADLLQSGNAFLFLRHLHVPAIDSIFSKQRIVDYEDFNLAGKMISSVAEHTGAPRTLCETYTGSGWDLTMEEMKQIFNRLAILGVNTIQFMGAYYSMRDLRKRMPILYPPSHSFQSSIWKYYGLFSDYISRLCYANSYGEHRAEIAVLMPSTSVWCEYALRHEFWDCIKPYEDRPYGDLDMIESTLQGINNALLQLQADYDLLHEPSLLEAEIGDGVLSFRGHRYKQLIIPSALTVTKEIWAKISGFISAGGRVCFVNLLPAYSPNQDGISDSVERLCGVSPAVSGEETRAIFIKGAVKSTQFHDYGKISHIISNELKRKDNAGLRSALKRSLDWSEPVFSLVEPCVHILMYNRHKPGEGGGTDMLLIVNDEQQTYSGTIRIRRDGIIAVYDPKHGAVSTPNCSKAEEGYQEMDLFLAGGQALLIEVNGDGKHVLGYGDQGEMNKAADPAFEMDISGEWKFVPEDGNNYMRLEMEVALTESTAIHLGKTWCPVPDFYFPGGEGFELDTSYAARATFTLKELPAVLELVIDPQDEKIITVNGTPLSPNRTECVWDRTNVIYDLKEQVAAGSNQIVIQSHIPGWGATHMPVFAVLRGCFGLDSERNIMALPDVQNVPGSWTEQGFADYSGTGIYSKLVQLDDLQFEGSIHVSVEGCRDIVELWCNGVHRGTSMWNPHYFNVSGQLKPGENRIELRVTNTLANLMERSVSSGLTSSVKLVFDDHGEI